MKKLFLIDDSDIIRDRIISMIEKVDNVDFSGYAEEPFDAIQKINDVKPDIVVLDIRIKNGNGIDVLKRVKKDHPEILVIMLTNFPYAAYKERCMEFGADYFFDKSNEFDKMIELISLQ